MGKKRRSSPVGTAGNEKERQRKTQKVMLPSHAPVPPGFIAKPAIPKSKHHTYLEFVENTEKRKKKLEFQITTTKAPPPGFDFVPIGDPQLTTACKELSRERDAMIFIVSDAKHSDSDNLALQVHRIGHHVRQTIVEEARAGLSSLPTSSTTVHDGAPEPIPDSQEEYDAQVDATLRDLFPRIPNTDRQEIIERSFQLRMPRKGEPPVGLSKNMTLARRVQLATLAHIRHNHTRYDDLLRETSWINARKVVERLCLDFIVKWRGDEETGRDQLDEILREVVVISDSEGSNSDSDSDSDSEQATDESSDDFNHPQSHNVAALVSREYSSAPGRSHLTPDMNNLSRRGHHIEHKKHQRGFKRYRAWEEAIQRNHGSATHPQRCPSGQGASVHLAPAIRLVEESRSGLSHPHTTGSPSLRYVDRTQISPQQTYHANDVTYPLLHHHQHEAPQTGWTGHLASADVAHSMDAFSQDRVIPSIEPPSPDTMRPAFVRSIPPRGSPRYGQVLNPFNDHRPDHQPNGNRNEVNIATCQDPNLGLRPGAAFPTFTDNEQLRWSGRNPGFQNQSVHMRDELPSNHRYPEQREFSAQRIVVSSSRPGDRSQQILMEDRGGFYEKISTVTDGNSLQSSMLTRPQALPLPGSFAGHSNQIEVTDPYSYHVVHEGPRPPQHIPTFSDRTYQPQQNVQASLYREPHTQYNEPPPFNNFLQQQQQQQQQQPLPPHQHGLDAMDVDHRPLRVAEPQQYPLFWEVRPGEGRPRSNLHWSNISRPSGRGNDEYDRERHHSNVIMLD